MWELSTDWWEMVLRAILIYLLVFILLRTIGKKQIGEMSPFDFVLLLIISEAVSNGLLGDDKSITGAAILATTLVALNALVDRVSFKFNWFERLLEGEMQTLVKEGRIIEKVREREKITMSEMESSLREHGLRRWEEVYLAVIETNGKISMIPYKEDHQSQTPSKRSPSH